MTAAPSLRRRVAAFGAFIGVGATAIFVTAVLFGNAGFVVLGLLGLGITVTGAWWAVTEHTRLRALGIGATIAGLIITAVAIAAAIDDFGQFVVRLLALIALVALTTACARVAMVRDLGQLYARARVAELPKHPVLILNPKSGGGKVERFGLVDLAHNLGVETVLLDADHDLEQLARDAVARGADCLGMAGGDGSQALVASVAIEHGLPFVCVSAGTRNHFALDLGLNRDDPRTSMPAFRDGFQRHVDYATVNGRLFVNNVSLGVYAQIVQEDSYRDAKAETTKALLPELIGPDAKPFDLQFTTPDGTDVDGAILVMISNNPYVLGPSPDNAQRRELDTGTLGVFAVTTQTGREAAALITAAAVGRRRQSPYWHEFRTTKFEVRSRSGHAYAGVDGEALDLPTPMHFEIHPRGLTLLVPKDDIEAAERRRARQLKLNDLVMIARGHDPDRRA